MELAIEHSRRATSIAIPAGTMAHHPLTQARIAEMHLELSAARAQLDRLATDWVDGADHGAAWPIHVFAAKWLVNRLGHFAEAHPDIDLRVSATLHHVDFAREEVDLAVRHGEGDWPGLDAVRLSTEQLFAVCSPKLLSGRKRLSRPADILKFPLIHMDTRADWTRWLQAAGVDGSGAIHGPVLNRASMVIDAAINGQGVALARTTLAAFDLISGRLARPFAEALRLSKTYWIVCPKASAALPKIKTFREWLMQEAADDLRRLRKLGSLKETTQGD